MWTFCLVFLFSSVDSWGTGQWKAPCNPANVSTQCGQYFQQCGPWNGSTDMWTDNRCYCIPYSSPLCCHGNQACTLQGSLCALSTPGQCNLVTHQCRTTSNCIPIGQIAGLTGVAALAVNLDASGTHALAANGTILTLVTAVQIAYIQLALALANAETLLSKIKTKTSSDWWTALGGNTGAEEMDHPTSEVMMPVTSSVALIFLSFFVGIILAYVIYKIKKTRNAQTKSQRLSDSSHQPLDVSVQLGALNLPPPTPRSGTEQV